MRLDAIQIEFKDIEEKHHKKEIKIYSNDTTLC